VAGVWVSPRMGPSWELAASLADASGCDGWSWPTLTGKSPHPASQSAIETCQADQGTLFSSTATVIDCAVLNWQPEWARLGR
jgi:hypothetical protein